MLFLLAPPRVTPRNMTEPPDVVFHFVRDTGGAEHAPNRRSSDSALSASVVGFISRINTAVLRRLSVGIFGLSGFLQSAKNQLVQDILRSNASSVADFAHMFQERRQRMIQSRSATLSFASMPDYAYCYPPFVPDGSHTNQ